MMRYEEYKAAIQSELRKNRAGLTWAELKERLSLGYASPCPQWTRRMEEEIGLTRTAGKTRALVWKVMGRKR